MDENNILFRISTWIVPLLLAVPLHEAAHGWVAYKLGDDTAYLAGRVTFNPFKHVDLFGTLIIPALLLFASGGAMMFGYAKPVPVNFWNLRSFRRDMVLVAIAGPFSNLFLAVASAALFHIVPMAPKFAQAWIASTLSVSMLINLILFFFNLIPLLPLDGGRVLTAILPPSLARSYARLERAGFAIILGALFLLPWIGNQLGMDLHIFRWIVGVPAFATMDFIIRLVGFG
ncbi:MAG: site-2 protease family protein [Rhodospirillales bacterium]|nr:site-2 protease family protein [Rhodospirillales bacterium]